MDIDDPGECPSWDDPGGSQIGHPGFHTQGHEIRDISSGPPQLGFWDFTQTSLVWQNSFFGKPTPIGLATGRSEDP